MMTLTRMNLLKRSPGYSKCDDHKIVIGGIGEDELNLIIQTTRESASAPRGWSFGIYEHGDMSKATWRASTAIVLPYQIRDDVKGSWEEVLLAASKLQIGHYVIDAEERTGKRTIVIVFPTSQTVNEAQYARLVGVLWDQMKGMGCSLSLSPGAAAMTHQLHIHKRSQAIWQPGPALNPVAKIKQTKHDSKQIDHRRMSSGSAAEAQLDQPTWTACDDLFEGLRG